MMEVHADAASFAQKIETNDCLRPESTELLTVCNNVLLNSCVSIGQGHKCARRLLFQFSSFETMPGLAAKLSRACPLSFRRRLSIF